MAAPHKPPVVMDDDAKFEFLRRKAKKKYKNQERKYRREAETEDSELNLTAMMDMMTILLVFLIKSYGAVDISVAMGPDLTPPSSKSTLALIKTVTVTITKKDIAVGEKGVVDLVNGKLPPGPPVIQPLKDALDAEVAKEKNIVANNPSERAKLDTPQDPTKTLTIVGDKDMTYETLFNVLGTAGLAELKYFKFLVINSGG